LAPEYIIGNWTDEEFGLMCEKLGKRKEREAKAWQGGRATKSGQRSGDALISDTELFRRMGSSVKVIKKDKK